MLVRKVLDYCMRCVVWMTIIVALTNVFFHSPGVMGQNTKMEFDEKKDAEVVRIGLNDNNEEMVVAASDVNRRYTRRVKLFDDIFNIPITVLQNVNSLIQGMFAAPGDSIMAASGFGRSTDSKQDKDADV